MTFVDFLAQGITGSPLGWILLYFVVMTQITQMAATLFLHRSATHRAVDFHPLVVHFFRFWIWLTTAMVPREWVAVHRKHHAKVETEDDPHSPIAHGIWKILFHGVELYQNARKDRDMVQQYSADMRDDWIERHLYAKHTQFGPALMVIINFALFGSVGVVVWALQMLWHPLTGASIINGLGHWWGYRNFETDDRSTNISPWGIIIGGEELHNNHHAFPSSAKFSLRKYEVDTGWIVLCIMCKLRLAKILRVAPTLAIRPNIALPDTETLKAVVVARFDLSKRYFREVIVPVLREEAAHADVTRQRLSRRLRLALANNGRWLDGELRQKLNSWIAHRPLLITVCQYRDQLQEIMQRTGKNSEAKLVALQEWCQQAESSGIRVLEHFSAQVRGMTLVTLR